MHSLMIFLVSILFMLSGGSKESTRLKEEASVNITIAPASQTLFLPVARVPK